MVTDFRPGVAAVVLRESATSVTRWVSGFAGITMLALLTVMPPFTEAEIRFANPGPPVSGPGSKNSGHGPPPVHRPLVHVGAAQISEPTTVTGTAVPPAHTGFVLVAMAGGGGALSCTARSDQLFAGVSAYS